MKNNLSLILIALLLITACSKKQLQLNDLQKNGLKGNVYKIKESTYGVEEKLAMYLKENYFLPTYLLIITKEI
jgi:hypothetical protein